MRGRRSPPVAVFAVYFGTVLPSDAVDVMPQQVAIFVLAIIALVIMQIAGHIVIAIVDRRTETDERDRLVRLKGTRNGGYVLATGVFLALCCVISPRWKRRARISLVI